MAASSGGATRDFIHGDPLGGRGTPTSLITGAGFQQQQQPPGRRMHSWNDTSSGTSQSLLPLYVSPTPTASPQGTLSGTSSNASQQKPRGRQAPRTFAPRGAFGPDATPRLTAIDGIPVDVLTRSVVSTADIEMRYQYADQQRRLYEYQTRPPSSTLARFWLQTRLGLLGYIGASVALLVVIQALMWLFVTYVLPESFKDDARMHQLLTTLDIAIGFLYITWFVGVDRGFVAPHTRYARLNTRLLTLEDHTYNAVLGQRADAATSAPMRQAALDCVHTFYVLYTYAYRMFTEHDTDVVLYELVPTDAHASRLLAEILHQRTHPFAVFRGALSLYETTITTVERERHATGTGRDNTRCIDEGVRGVRAELEEMDTGARVRTPWLLRNHLIVILGTYFLVLSPIGCAIRFDLASLAIFPVVTFLLAGNYVYQQFLGDPFTSMPEFTGMDPLEWRAERLAESRLRYTYWLGADSVLATTSGGSRHNGAPSRASWQPGTPPAVPHSIEEMHRAGTSVSFGPSGGGGGHSGGIVTYHT